METDKTHTCCSLSPDQLAVRTPSTATIKSPHSVAYSFANTNECDNNHMRRTFGHDHGTLGCQVLALQQRETYGAIASSSFARGNRRYNKCAPWARIKFDRQSNSNSLCTMCSHDVLDRAVRLITLRRVDHLVYMVCRHGRAFSDSDLRLRPIVLISSRSPRHLQSPAREQTIGRDELGLESVAFRVDWAGALSDIDS